MYRLKRISPFSNTNLCSSASVSWRYDTARVCCWGPLLRRRRCRSIFSAHVTHSSNPPRTAAAVDRRDRQTDRLTDTVPLHRSIADYAISVNNFEPCEYSWHTEQIYSDSYRWSVVVPWNYREDGAAKRSPFWLLTRQEQHSVTCAVGDVHRHAPTHAVVMNHYTQDSYADKTPALEHSNSGRKNVD